MHPSPTFVGLTSKSRLASPAGKNPAPDVLANSNLGNKSISSMRLMRRPDKDRGSHGGRLTCAHEENEANVTTRDCPRDETKE